MKHFKITEFDSPDVKGSGVMMDDSFLDLLDDAREVANTPFKINSGYRTEKHNSKVGGKPTSSHTKGLAADIHCVNDRLRWQIVDALICVGFTRIGIAKTFIHVDLDHDKNDAIWIY
jgi:uncharacterized protein YcbK (DUF882 family)